MPAPMLAARVPGGRLPLIDEVVTYRSHSAVADGTPAVEPTAEQAARTRLFCRAGAKSVSS